MAGVAPVRSNARGGTGGSCPLGVDDGYAEEVVGGVASETPTQDAPVPTRVTALRRLASSRGTELALAGGCRVETRALKQNQPIDELLADVGHIRAPSRNADRIHQAVCMSDGAAPAWVRTIHENALLSFATGFVSPTIRHTRGG